MRKAIEIVGLVMACVFGVAFVIDKIYEWTATSKLLRMFKKFEPLTDKAVDYMEENWDDIF